MNEYFRSKLEVNEDKVIVSAIVNQDGTVAVQGENKIILTLVNLEREISAFNHSPQVSGAQTLTRTTPSSLSLYLLFSAYFSSNNYAEALRFLSSTIAYLQSNCVISRSSAASLDPRIDKLTMEMVSLTTEQLNNIWNVLGAKYMPSVFYKMRMLVFDESIIREVRPEIKEDEQQSKAK